MKSPLVLCEAWKSVPGKATGPDQGNTRSRSNERVGQLAAVAVSAGVAGP
jgi:hypothetical protein